MPDVVRSDSQRSDASLRPRVSFNRDVHVKRIVPNERKGSLSTEENGYSPKKGHSRRSRKEAEEADPHRGFNSEKFYSLPRTRKKNEDLSFPSLDRSLMINKNIDSKPPKKPQRIFAPQYKNQQSTPTGSLKKPRTHLHRSVSDASKLFPTNDKNRKKQLSPIVEQTPREDYFSPIDKENHNINKEDGSKGKKRTAKKDEKKIIVIDIDEAEEATKTKKSKSSIFGKKIKSITKRKKNPDDRLVIDSHSSTMVHSSQKPAEKPPLTRGRTVDLMVRRLNNDTSSPPPKPTVLVAPNPSVQHNSNQPFSYTRGLSPEKLEPLIYAQVVCGSEQKQTVHKSYPKRLSQSDSDEGLGHEDKSPKHVTHFGDELRVENPITPKYKAFSSHDIFESRGCADGMEARRRESSLERLDESRNTLSARRDLLESRITRKINDSRGVEGKFERSASSSPVSNTLQKRYSSDLDSSKLYYDEPKSFESYKEYRKYESKQWKNLCKSTPDIYHRSDERPSHHQHSYHDSLQRDKYRAKSEKDKFGDSGIENDIKRETSAQKSRYTSYAESEDEGFASSLLIANDKHAKNHAGRKLSRRDYDSDMTFSGEDDAYRNADTTDYKAAEDYVPRERSIDDGSHFDPMIDKEVAKETPTLKRVVKKSQKTEKKSGLEKVKQLFTRDSKKKKEKDMVREESLLARYTEYKGADYSDYKKETESDETSKNMHHGSRKRLPTPSPNSSPVQELENSKKTANTRTSWFKSLDRISRNTLKKKEPKVEEKRSSPKNLRFFGDTDSDEGPRKSTALKDRVTSQSSRDLHNISEDSDSKRRPHHKSMLNISESREHRTRLHSKPPISPNPRAVAPKPPTTRRRKYEQSEGSTEGDSSQQSQKSVVYLHAATVGDIPGPASLRYGQKSASKEEIATSDSSRIQPQTKKISRSFSVLAPWRPRLPHDARQIDYSQYQSSPRRKESTLKKKTPPKSKENGVKEARSATLYKKKERVPREYLRYSKEKDEKKAAKYRSAESLRHNGTVSKKSSRDISRSVSMPKDPERVAGWYKSSKKEHHKSDYIAQRV